MSLSKVILVLIAIIFLLLALLAPRTINDLANFFRDIFAGHGVTVK